MDAGQRTPVRPAREASAQLTPERPAIVWLRDSISCALNRPVPVQIDRDTPAPDQPELERGLALPLLDIGCVADPEVNAGHAGIEIAERTNVWCEQVERSADVAVATVLESRILVAPLACSPPAGGSLRRRIRA